MERIAPVAAPKFPRNALSADRSRARVPVTCGAAIDVPEKAS